VLFRLNMKRYDIINYLTSKFPDCKYLEIGSGEGDCFKRIKAKLKHDVEPYTTRNPTFRMTSDYFFENERYELLNTTFRFRQYDVIFIDGLHHCEQVIKDIHSSLFHLSENGYIVVHDCLPLKKEWQEREQTELNWMGDVWRAQVWLVKNFYESVLTIDEDCGCGIIRNIRFTIPPIDELLSISWEDFEKNKNEMLNLISFKEFKNE